ncbi:MAG: serine hydrolase [Gemmatimonadota bacterium]|nr:serine hydrolase [Gemmatimonadota bacterium]
MRIKVLALPVVVTVLFALCSGPPVSVSQDSGGDYYPPPESNGGWRKNTDPEFVRSLGLDPGSLEQFGRFNMEVPNSQWMPYGKYKGIIVIKNGWIAGEWYNNPEARAFKTYISSNGKSFAMVLFGIMAQQSQAGRIEVKIDADSKVYNRRWLPRGFPLSDPLKKQITFEQVFSHTSGLCPERTSAGETVEKGRNEWTDYEDWVLGHDEKWPQTGKLYFTPGHPEEYPGSKTWGMVSSAYSSVSFGHIGLVLSNVYGMPVRDFLWNSLLEPIGFGGIDFHSPPSERIKWFSAGGLRITPRDYARFALLLLRDGRWNEKQIVPAAWIRRFRKSALYPNIRSNADGYFGEQYPKDMFRIAGSGLNWAFIVPSLDLVALRTGRSSNEIWDEVQEKFLEKLFASVADRKGQEEK